MCVYSLENHVNPTFAKFKGLVIVFGLLEAFTIRYFKKV